jgi:hypothetical protein
VPKTVPSWNCSLSALNGSFTALALLPNTPRPQVGILAESICDERPIPTLPKNKGVYYLLDSQTGKRVWRPKTKPPPGASFTRATREPVTSTSPLQMMEGDPSIATRTWSFRRHSRPPGFGNPLGTFPDGFGSRHSFHQHLPPTPAELAFTSGKSSSVASPCRTLSRMRVTSFIVLLY